MTLDEMRDARETLLATANRLRLTASFLIGIGRGDGILKEARAVERVSNLIKRDIRSAERR